MRHIVKHPDGREEILEGSPQEIEEALRRIEDRRRPIQEAPKKPEVLRGKELEELIEMLKLFPKSPEPSAPSPYQWPDGPIWIVPCYGCRCYPCSCRKRWTSPYRWPYTTWSSDSTAAPPYSETYNG